RRIHRTSSHRSPPPPPPLHSSPTRRSSDLHGNAPPISPADAFDGYGGIGDYRHSNGNIWDVLRAGHAMRDGAFERRLATAIAHGDRKSTRLNSSHRTISYAVFCLKKKKQHK